MERSSTRSAVTLAVLGVVLVIMVVVGWRSATAAFPDRSSTTAEKCETPKVVKVIYRRDITVSVYNAGAVSGYADKTMGSMERRNFKVGSVGNAPDGTDFSGVQIWTTSKDDPRAQLVALQYKPTAKIVVTDEDLGPGVDVILGAKAPYPYVPAPKSVKPEQPIKTCLDDVTADPSTGAGS